MERPLGTRRIKVCQVLNAYRIGGAEAVALDIARSLDPDEFISTAVALVQPPGDEPSAMLDRFRQAGVTSHVVHGDRFRHPRTLWKIFRYFRRERPDILHAHNRPADYWSVRIGGWAGVPHRIWTRHSVYPGPDARLESRYRRIASQADRVLAVSDAVAHHCRDIERIPASKVRTIVNGIDTDRFRPLTEGERNAARNELGLTEDEQCLLFVGRLVDQKAPDGFVRLVGRMRGEGRPVRGFMCGYGIMADQLTRLAGDDGGVELLGLRNDIPRLLGACDLFVSTSRVEGLPLNIMEAMAAGAAFCGPELDQIVQLARHDDLLASGLFPAPSVDEEIGDDLVEFWAEVVATRLDNPELRHRCGVAGRRVIEAEFSLARNVTAHVDLYRSLVGR